MTETRTHNRLAWDQLARDGIRWSQPVTAEETARARRGNWSIVLTPCKPVPESWLPKDLSGKTILCLASGGGQQGPVLAAAGANVTVFDNSPEQLSLDALVAERDGLPLKTIEGDMADLSTFGDHTYDLIVHSCSNCFAEHIRPVWSECSRVLKTGGSLLSGFGNPVLYAFDHDLEEDQVFQLKYPVPYSDVDCLSTAELDKKKQRLEPLEFGHTMGDQI